MGIIYVTNYACPVCQEMFDSQKELDKHARETHSQEEIEEIA